MTDVGLKDSIFLCFSCRDNIDDEICSNMPRDVFMDINVSYRKLLCKTDVISSKLLFYADLKKTDVGADELFELAKRNTKKLFKPFLFRLEDILGQLMGGKRAENIYNSDADISDTGEMYVLTNERGCFGAIWMVYPEVLERIGRRMGKSFYILPSSVHELILVPDGKEVNQIMLKNMVMEINKTEVDTEDKMSDSIYYFDMSDLKLRRVA